MTPLDTKQVMRQLLAAFPKARIDTDTVVLYARALEPFDLDVVELAITKLITASDGRDDFPTLPKLLAVIRAEARRLDDYVDHLDPGEVHEMNEIVENKSTWRERGKAGVERARMERDAALRRRRFPTTLEHPADAPTRAAS